MLLNLNLCVLSIVIINLGFVLQTHRIKKKVHKRFVCINYKLNKGSILVYIVLQDLQKLVV